jgi:hypothetical protein
MIFTGDVGREHFILFCNNRIQWSENMSRKDFELMVEVESVKKYASVILTPKEFRKGRKRWMQKHNT